MEPAFVLFFDCPEEELERRIMNRNQVGILSENDISTLGPYLFLQVVSWFILGKRRR